MKVDILREIPWVAGNYFKPVYFDDNVFKMESCLRAGKSVPAHYHKYFDENWVVKAGRPVFAVGNEKHERGPGETFSAPKMVEHALLNPGKEDVVLYTEMHPAADMAKMMAVIAGLQDDKEGNWLFKYLYVEKRAGLKEFSNPTGMAMKIMTAAFTAPTMAIGRLAGWDKFLNKYF